MHRKLASRRLQRPRASVAALMMPCLGASDCSKRGLRACYEARRPSAASAPEARRRHPNSWSIHVIETAADVELVPQGKWARASTAQRRTSRFDNALRVLMLRHDHPWPRVQWRDGSSATANAHADKHSTKRTQLLPFRSRCQVLQVANARVVARPDDADKVALPHRNKQ